MSNLNEIASKKTATIKNLLLIVLIIGGLYFAQSFLIPLAIGAILATLFLPLCQKLESKKIPKGLAAFICILLLLLILGLIFSLLGWQISELTSDINLLKQKSAEKLDEFQQFVIKQFGYSLNNQNQVIKENQKAAINFIYSFVSSVGSIFIRFILVITYIFLLLYYRSHIKAFFLKLTASNKQKEMEKLIDGATHVSQQYLLGLFKMIVCLWIMYGIGFALVGVKNPFMFAIICGLMEIVPFIGNITGTTLTVLVSAVNGASLNVLGAIVLIYGVVQFIQGWFLEPLILGPQVKINPLFTIIALVLGEIIWGIPGIILAIPITAIFKITCDHIESLKPLGFLIGEIKENKKISPLFKKSKLD